MERTAVNSWDWSVSMGFNQGEVVAGHARTLFCAGQTSVSADGARSTPAHGDQTSLALDNLEGVLERAGMARSTTCSFGVSSNAGSLARLRWS